MSERKSTLETKDDLILQISDMTEEIQERGQQISNLKQQLAEKEKEIERLKKDDLRGISNLASWLADYLCEKHNKEFLALKTYGDVAKFSEEKLGCAFCNRERAKKAEAKFAELRERMKGIEDFYDQVMNNKDRNILLRVLNNPECQIHFDLWQAIQKAAEGK